ncbi:MAG: helix-turn-helix transcriptional regulator [Armatimonadetes bacterium]|nr:helix-turn-helix transcriptional regulator [Akkermansiaceae bacterium]
MTIYAIMQEKCMPADGLTNNQLVETLQRSTSLLGITQVELAKLSGISQSQVSRILAGRFSRRSKAIIQLCKCLKIYPDLPIRTKTQTKRLEIAVVDVWDGTPGHEAAILRLLEALRAVTRT